MSDAIRDAIKQLSVLPDDEVETILDGIEHVDDLWWSDENGVTTLTVVIVRG